MDLNEKSTLSYDESSKSSDECEENQTNNDEEREEIYDEEGIYDSNDADDEDPKLKNWRKWLTIRKKQQEKLKLESNRDPNDLVMNTEDVYDLRQKRKLIEDATNYKKFDKYRGDPKFWTTPNYLYEDQEKCQPINWPAQEKFDRTLIDKNEPPTLEYVGIPDLVKYEKGLLQVDSSLKKCAHKCNYFDDRKKELKYNIDLIETFSPDLDNLYVHGLPLPVEDSMQHHVKDIKSDTTIIIEGVKGEKYEDCSLIDDRYPIIKIQDTIIDKETLIRFGDFEKTIEFQNCSTNQLYSSKLVIENVGNICMRFSLEQNVPYNNTMIPLRYSTQLVKRFFFPAIVNVVPPGQIIEIPIWFKSRESGVFHETWTVLFEPKLSKNKLIQLKLQAFVRAELILEKRQEIDSFIKKCRAQSAAVELYDSLLIDNKLEKPIPYDYLFMNKDLFLHNNPDYFYEAEKVQSLVEMYEKIPSYRDWDLSINTLRNNILNNVKGLEDKRKYISELYEISNSLLKSTNKVDIDNEKYRCVYQILCSFCNMIEQDSFHLRVAYGIAGYDISQKSLDVIEEEKISGSFSKMSKTSLKLSINKWRSSSITGPSIRQRAHSAIAHTVSLSDSTLNSKNSESTLSLSIESKKGVDSEAIQELRKSYYIKTLSIKTYQHLLTAVDEITGVIESLCIFLKPET